MPPKISKEDLLAELDDHNGFFDVVVDMFSCNTSGVSNQANTVPAKTQSLNTKFHKKAGVPAAQKLDRQVESKRRKLNPTGAEESTMELKRTSKNPKNAAKNTPDDNGSKLPQKNKSSLHSADQEEEQQKSEKTPVIPPKSRIDRLRAKLQAKIAEKQIHRPNTTPDQVSKRAARRADKLKRQEEAKKRAQKKSLSSVSTTNVPQYHVAASYASPAQDLATIDFGRLTGLKQKDLDPTAKSKEILQNLTKSKNLHKMLKDAEEKQLKLEQLKQEGDKEKLAALQWKDTFKVADGTRLKDDPAKLKKSLKRKAAKKAKSQKAWQARTEQVSAAAQERQKIRQHNINARKQGGKTGANLSRKEIRLAPDDKDSKPVSRPGFEGRKQGFLNKDKKKPAPAKQQ